MCSRHYQLEILKTVSNCPVALRAVLQKKLLCSGVPLDYLPSDCAVTPTSSSHKIAWVKRHQGQSHGNFAVYIKPVPAINNMHFNLCLWILPTKSQISLQITGQQHATKQCVKIQSCSQAKWIQVWATGIGYSQELVSKKLNLNSLNLNLEWTCYNSDQV